MSIRNRLMSYLTFLPLRWRNVGQGFTLPQAGNPYPPSSTIPHEIVPDSGVLRREMENARDVQRASIPQVPPAIPGLNCASFYQPVLSVGGDYFDFLPLQNGAWGIAIGDVSGKGIGAALVMAELRGLLRSQLLQPRGDLETLMANINRLIRQGAPESYFASLFYGEYEPETRVLRYVNAGHNPPVVLRRRARWKAVLPLKPACAPVGLLQDSWCTGSRFQLEVGDVVIAYTDGVTEWENAAGSPYGHQRLEKMLSDCCAQYPNEILQCILSELSEHSAGRPQADDVTLVVMQVQERETAYQDLAAGI